jgi:hypothetical protein
MGGSAGGGGFSHAQAWAVTLGYAAVVSLLSWRHVLWRDEVRALNIATACASPWSLIACLHNEGHPGLWYLLLQLGYRLTDSLWVLKPTSILVASAAMYLMLRWAPFRRSWKLLFLFGYFPLFAYAVMCRSYGLTMLLLFAVATVHGRRFTHPWGVAVLLALLANTSAFGFVFALALLAGLLLERVLLHRLRGVATLVSITLAGVVLAAITMLPDSTTSVTAVHAATLPHLIVKVVKALALPAGFVSWSAGAQASAPLLVVAAIVSIALTALFWLLVIQLLDRPWRAVALYLAAVGCTLVDSVYPARTLQLGQFAMFLLLLGWTAADSPPWRPTLGILEKIATRSRPLLVKAVPSCLLVHAVFGLGYAADDLLIPQSRSRSLGEFINSRPDLRDAIVLGEPDFFVEALPYYAKVRMFNARENAYFVDRVHFTSINRQDFTLDQLIESARQVQRESTRPVVLAIGHALKPEGPFVLAYGYGKVFRYSADSLLDFQRQVTPLASFTGSRSEEDFAAYLLRPAPTR